MIGIRAVKDVTANDHLHEPANGDSGGEGDDDLAQTCNALKHQISEVCNALKQQRKGNKSVGADGDVIMGDQKKKQYAPRRKPTNNTSLPTCQSCGNQGHTSANCQNPSMYQMIN